MPALQETMLPWEERVSRLRDLKSLLDEGVLTEAEFASGKADLLGAVSSSSKKKSVSVMRGSRRGWDVRTADTEDAAAVVALVNAAHTDSFRVGPRISIEEVTASMQGEACTWLVAEVGDEQILGCVCLRLLGPVASRLASIETLSVQPEYQKRGVGTKMLRLAEASAVNNAATLASVECVVGENGFFESRGYLAQGHAMEWPKHLAHEISRPTKTQNFQKSLVNQPQPSGTTTTASSPQPSGTIHTTKKGNTLSLSSSTNTGHMDHPEKKRFAAGSTSVGTDPPPAPSEAEQSAVDSMSAQIEFAGALSGFASMLDGLEVVNEGDDETPSSSKGGDDAELEGLLGSLLKSLKSDQGREQFEILAEKQRGGQDLASKSPFPGFVARPDDDDSAGVEVSFDNPQSMTDLLRTDDRFAERAQRRSDADQQTTETSTTTTTL